MLHLEAVPSFVQIIAAVDGIIIVCATGIIAPHSGQLPMTYGKVKEHGLHVTFRR